MSTEIDRSGTQVDWHFVRGDTWNFDFQFNVATTGAPTTGEPADLSGSSWDLAVRVASTDGSGTKFADAVMTTSAQASGAVVGTVPTSATSGASTGKKVYIYDAQRTAADGTISTPVWGYVHVRADQTRPT